MMRRQQLTRETWTLNVLRPSAVEPSKRGTKRISHHLNAHPLPSDRRFHRLAMLDQRNALPRDNGNYVLVSLNVILTNDRKC